MGKNEEHELNGKVMAAKMVTLIDGRFRHADAVVKLEGETLKLLYYQEKGDEEPPDENVR